MPKLRFPGFEGEYRITTLGEIADKIVRTDPNSDAPIMMISAASGFINQSKKYSRENAGQSLKKYTLLKKGELAYNHGASKLRQFGCCFELKEKAARIPYVYHTFSINEKEYAPYIALLLNNPIMDRQLKRLVSSSVRMDGLLNISYDEYMSIKLRIPMLKAEQEKLYAFIEKLDQRIERQRQLVDALKSYKRGALSRLFPKNGASVPEYRFSGFTDDWEQRKLGEIAPLRGGFAFKSDEYASDGVPIVRISNILSDGSIGAEFAYYPEQNNDTAYSLSNGAVLLAMSGATTGKVSILRCKNTEKYYQNQRVGFFVPTLECDYGLVSILARSQYFVEQLDGVLVAGAQPNVSAKNIDAFEFRIPTSYDEQKRIGKFFDLFDNLITLHQRKLDEYKSIKQELLVKLFI